MSISKEIANKLARYTPCDISDALVHLGVKSGGYIPNLVQRSTMKDLDLSSAGPAYTVLYAPKSDPRPAVKQLYIDEIPEGSLLVLGLTLECQRPYAPYVTINNALYGGLMLTRAKYRGAHGLVVLGRIRDLDEHRALGYPVWLYGVGSTAPGPVVKVVGINVPLEVRVGELDSDVVTVHPGDLVIADENGVVTFSGEDTAQKVVDYVPRRVEADSHVAEDIKNGRPAAEAQKFWRSKI